MAIDAKYSLCILLLTGLITLPGCNHTALGAQPVSFDQALECMLTSNESVKVARLEIQRNRHQRRAARGLYFPKITLDGRATRIDDPIELDLGPIREAMLALHPDVPAAAVPSFKQTVQDETFWKAQFNLLWPVYTGGRITAANSAAKAGTRAAEAKLRRTTDNLTTDLVRRYFGVRLADRVAQVRADTKAALDLHLFQARRMHAEGVIARTELLHAQVAQSQADRALKAARHDLDLARTALADLILSPAAITPTTPLFVLADLSPVETYIHRALDAHPALAQLGALEEKAHAGLRAEKAQRAPQVYLFGTRELHESDLTLLEPAWAAGVGVTLTLFDGLSRRHKILAAREQRDQARLLRKQLARNLETQVVSTYQEILKAREQYEALQTTLDLAAENLRARMRAFEAGLATSLDVVDAQLSSSAAETQRLNAAYDFDLALARMLAACGQAFSFRDYLQRPHGGSLP